MKFLNIGDEEIATDGVAGTDMKLTELGVVHILNLFLTTLNQMHGRFNVLQQKFARRGKLNFLGASG